MPAVSWSGPIAVTLLRLSNTMPGGFFPRNMLKHFGPTSYVAALEILSACTDHLITVFPKW